MALSRSSAILLTGLCQLGAMELEPPPKGTQQTAGALGKGTVVAAAVTSSFGFLVYALVCGSISIMLLR